MYSKIHFRNKEENVFENLFPAGATQQHKDEMFDQMLKYRKKEYRMSLYIKINYDHLWISMNEFDNFTMASRTRRPRDVCRRS
jgi:hypothetical protein